MGRLLSYNKPEWPFFVPAILGALVDGAAMPLCTVALVGSMKAFYKARGARERLAGGKKTDTTGGAVRGVWWTLS